MARVVVGGNREFNAFVYGEPHPGTLEWLGSQAQNMSQNVNEAGQAFMARALSAYEQFNGEEALRISRAAIHKAQTIFQRDEIRGIWDIGSFQNAPLTMQRWISANPVVRKKFQEQACDGYAGTYMDMYPNTIGNDHYDYRRVMHGHVVDDEEDNWKVTFHLDELVEGDRELTPTERVEILSTWDRVEQLMALGEDDPTSPVGGKL